MMKPLIIPRKSPNVDDSPRLAYSIAEVAQLVGCSERSVRTLVKTGHIHARKHRGRVFISAESLQEFLAAESDDAGTESNN